MKGACGRRSFEAGGVVVPGFEKVLTVVLIWGLDVDSIGTTLGLWMEFDTKGLQSWNPFDR